MLRESYDTLRDQPNSLHKTKFADNSILNTQYTIHNTIHLEILKIKEIQNLPAMSGGWGNFPKY